MELPNNPEILRDEARNNAIREAIIELYKLELSSVEVQEVIKLLEKLLHK